ncbi:C40 family peptidase [uncultured Williamsia sp.]|uniref:C40 family peptidase n=1 Tax=uncultured Williamsia sp. TaxID=259311 RepID=UPI003458EE9E
MSGMVTALAAPIRALLDAVGSGSLPGDGPLAGLRTAADGLDRVAADVGRFTAATEDVWASTGADGARQTADAQRTHLAGLADDARTVADIGDEAGVAVAEAATGLRGVLDSFTAAADALGPAISQPPGLLALVGLAATHLARALVIVGRAQATLAGLQRRAEAIGRRRAPALPDLTRLRRVTGDHGADTRGASAGSPTAGTAHGASTSAASANGRVAITLPDGSVAYAPNERAATAVRAALSQRGVPYAWGGTTPGRGLDCSALTQYAYRQAGVELPRLAQDQDTAGYRVDRGELLPGDLAVWSGHVAMVVGNGQMIEAGDPVGISPIRTSNAGQRFEGFFRPR